MRIQEVSKLTGLSKKTIHFYVNEGLIHPAKLQNNYYEFSDSELSLLKQIILFRKAGLSIQTIKEIYEYPAATNFFLHRSFNHLKQEIAEKMIQLQNLETILETIPPNGTPIDVENISDDYIHEEFDTYWIDQMHPSIDERMIAILLLAPFMDIQVDEYKTYLWDKIFNDLKYHLKDNTKILSKLIYSLNSTQIKESSLYQFHLMNKIAEAKDIQPYVDYLLQCIEDICINKELQEKWKLLYHPVIVPVENFLRRTSDKKRISQYNPLFDQYTLQLNSIIQECKNKLSGSDLEKQLINCLDSKISINDASYSDLFILFTFHKSIYAECSLETIKQAIKTAN